MQSKSTDWFLYNGNIEKQNMINLKHEYKNEYDEFECKTNLMMN